MNRGKLILIFTLMSLITLVIAICDKNEMYATSEKIPRPEGWKDKTHGDYVDPNYDIVFPQDRINRIKITINHPDDWERMS